MEKDGKKKEETAAQPQQPQEAEMEKQLADYKDSLQRLQAEFENYKKRVDREKSQSRQLAAAEMAKEFLPVLDSFELAIKALGNSSDAKLTKGMEMIYGQFYSVLESAGLRPIKAVGEKLDPYRHEVLLQEETADEKKDGLVVEEFQKGYVINGIILRYSKVKVLKFVSKEEKTQ